MFLNYANSTSNKDGQNMNKNTDLHINSCGTYRLYTKSELTTLREYGRNDYQLIYIYPPERVIFISTRMLRQ